MYRFLETIRLEEGKLQKLELHNIRMKHTLSVFYPGTDLRLSQKLAAKAPKKGLFKCRVVYDTQIREVEFIPYKLPSIHSLQLVVADPLDYSFKFLNRTPLNQLVRQRKQGDDILIVKQGLITDTSFCNVLFFNGKNWITPAQPLLKGVQRQYLLENERIHTADIRPGDMHQFIKIRLVNAMIRFEDALDILPENIYF